MGQPLENGFGEDEVDNSEGDFEGGFRNNPQARVQQEGIPQASVQQDDLLNAFYALCNANRYGIDPAERNNHLREMGKFMFSAGRSLIARGVSMRTMASNQPNNNRAIFPDVIVPCSLIIAGSAGMIVGGFLMCYNDPGLYLSLATLAVLLLAVGYVLANIFG